MRPFLIPNRGAYLERLEDWLGLVDLVKVSQADLEWLYPGQDPETIALEWKSHGPVMVIVTRGGQGALAVCGSGITLVQAPQVQVVDTVGAGDAFMSGTLSWLWSAGVWSRAALESLNTEQATALLGFAARVAAITCTRAGANPPWRGEL